MYHLSIVAETQEAAALIAGEVASIFKTCCLGRADISQARPEQYVVFDVDLEDGRRVTDVGQWLKRRPKDAKVIFAVERGIHHQIVQAYAIGASDVVSRPVSRNILLAKLLGSNASCSCNANGDTDAVSAGTGALNDIFSAIAAGRAPDLDLISSTGQVIVSQIQAQGLGSWVETVRNHHSQTYQHCLLVTGVAVSFGLKLGFSRVDQQKLAFAGLLHDVGKARIPLKILEKPGPLDATELALMRQHPLFGFEALQNVKYLHPQMLDMVVHHHEYLDGSGYPHRLRAGEVSDFVRVVTIADIFGALIERRAYKAPMSGEAAYDILQSMASKLDKDLVREFRAVIGLQ